jgi:UDP-glucose 4-epimerase
MRCLVTGGLGFIGSHLVKRLRELGHEVMILDDESNSVTRARPIDLVKDISTMLVPRAKWVFHLAAVSRTQTALADPQRCFQVNARGSFNVLESERLDPRGVRIVLASSNIVYGSPNPYKASKVAMEELMHAYNACYGLNCIALRYSNVYGPGMRWDDSICLAAMRRSAVEKGYVEVTGDGSQSRDFTHVSDIVEATILAAASPFKGVLDVTSEEHRSMKQMAGFFKVPIRHVAARVGDTLDIMQCAGDAYRDLGWVAKVQVERGMQDVLNDKPKAEVAA